MGSRVEKGLSPQLVVPRREAWGRAEYVVDVDIVPVKQDGAIGEHSQNQGRDGGEHSVSQPGPSQPDQRPPLARVEGRRRV